MNRIGECNITLKEFSELGRDGFNVICATIINIERVHPKTSCFGILNFIL